MPLVADAILALSLCPHHRVDAEARLVGSDVSERNAHLLAKSSSSRVGEWPKKPANVSRVLKSGGEDGI